MTCLMRAAGLAEDPAVAALQQRVQAAMQLAPDAKVEFVKLHDTLTVLRTHSKQVSSYRPRPACDGMGWG